MNLKTNISELKNIGEKRKELFAQIGLNNVNDLINYYPTSYEDRGNIIELESYEENKFCSVIVELDRKPQLLRFNKLYIVKAIAYDDSSKVELVWFNQKYIANTLDVGKSYYVFGKTKTVGKKIVMEVKDFYLYEGQKIEHTIIPIYKLPKGLSQKIFRKTLISAIENINEEITDYLNDSIKSRYNLINLNDALRFIHFHNNNEEFFAARIRLIFDELFLRILSLKEIKQLSKHETDIILNDTCYDELKKLFPYDLTNSQKKVIDEIMFDIKKNLTMNRLVQGDVGSGKTIVSIICAYLAIKNGYQCVIMAPTEVLANQHYLEFTNYFNKLGITTELLIGSVKGKKRKIIEDSIRDGYTQMVVGTQAIIQDKIEFDNLGLVITDEQHRFGVNQRASLSDKGTFPHTLVMSATPIPRTLGLILYGDLDISIIDELPPGRQIIDTFFVNTSYRDRLFSFIEKHVENGNQVYCICPSIEDNEDNNLVSVESYYNLIKNNIDNNIVVDVLHGKMKQIQKDKIMSDYLNKKINVLISTTVIEVGINIPNATLIIIEDSHRFGLAQLHQLRGRVGRGKDKSYCVLVSDTKAKSTKKRLKIMTETNNGYELAEKDMEIRGYGDFFGSAQSGLVNFEISDIKEDIAILNNVKEIINEIENNSFPLSEEDKLKIMDKVMKIKVKNPTIYL